MEIEARPPLAPAERAVVAEALEVAEVELEGVPPGYASLWRVTGLAESTSGEDDVLEVDYTRSPRSTLGASRA